MPLEMKMENPWRQLSSNAPFVLNDDLAVIKAYNQFHEKQDTWINLSHTPEPRLGPVSAPVIILQLNPSYLRADLAGSTDSDRVRRDMISIKDESHEHLGAALLDHWWKPRLSKLIGDVGTQQLSKRLCSIEFFPYRSLRFGHGQIRLPSQAYTFSLVRNGLARNALFIVARNLELWTSAVPELLSRVNDTVYCLNNRRSSYYTERNLPPGCYKKIVERLCGNLDC